MPRTNIKDKRKQQLINATVDCIAKRGLTETTITHISKGAGMSRGIINFYFTSKEMMMREVLGTLIEEYETVWQAAWEAAGTNARNQLEAIVNAHFDRKICSPKRLNVLSAFWGHAASHEAYRTKIDESDSKLLQAIITLWTEIAPQGFNPEQFARQLHAMIRGMWLSYLLAPKTTDREELAKECLSFIDQHITPIRMVSAKTDTLLRAQSATAPKPKKRVAANTQMDIEDLFANAK